MKVHFRISRISLRAHKKYRRCVKGSGMENESILKVCYGFRIRNREHIENHRRCAADPEREKSADA